MIYRGKSGGEMIKKAMKLLKHGGSSQDGEYAIEGEDALRKAWIEAKGL